VLINQSIRHSIENTHTPSTNILTPTSPRQSQLTTHHHITINKIKSTFTHSQHTLAPRSQFTKSAHSPSSSPHSQIHTTTPQLHIHNSRQIITIITKTSIPSIRRSFKCVHISQSLTHREHHHTDNEVASTQSNKQVNHGSHPPSTPSNKQTQSTQHHHIQHHPPAIKATSQTRHNQTTNNITESNHHTTPSTPQPPSPHHQHKTNQQPSTTPFNNTHPSTIPTHSQESHHKTSSNKNQTINQHTTNITSITHHNTSILIITSKIIHNAPHQHTITPTTEVQRTMSVTQGHQSSPSPHRNHTGNPHLTTLTC